MANAFDPEAAGAAQLSAADQALVARRARLLGPAYRLFYRTPIHPVRAEGVWLYDAQGRRYLDGYNNVASVGHCHPEVVAAIARQASVLNTHTRYLHETVLDCAEALLATMPGEPGHVMFTCTGSEANDLALRIAQTHTGGTGVVVTSHAYHGVTHAIAQLSPSLGPGVVAGPHVRTVLPPDIYRRGENDGARFAADVARAMADLQAAGVRPAALLCDSLFSSDGVFPASLGCLADAAAAAHAAGALFIADEVQAGFGRTGESMWGFARHGVTPDLITLGKPMGNGHPVAGVVGRPQVLERFGQSARYFNTFGGNPVSCAAALAVLQVIARERLQENALRIGALLADGLRALAVRYPMCGDVRGAGLFIGVEIVADAGTRAPDAEYAAAIVAGMRDRDVLISATGPAGNVLKIRPPLVFTEEHVEIFLAALDDTLHTLAAAS